MHDHFKLIQLCYVLPLSKLCHLAKILCTKIKPVPCWHPPSHPEEVLRQTIRRGCCCPRQLWCTRRLPRHTWTGRVKPKTGTCRLKRKSNVTIFAIPHSLFLTFFIFNLWVLMVQPTCPLQEQCWQKSWQLFHCCPQFEQGCSGHFGPLHFGHSLILRIKTGLFSLQTLL